MCTSVALNQEKVTSLPDGVKSENKHLEFCAFLSFQPLVGLLLRMSAVHDG